MAVRPVQPEDVPVLGAVAESAGLFPAEFLPDMIAPSFDGGSDVWRLCENAEGTPCGFAFARLEELTDRVWNILALCVGSEDRGVGHASALLAAMEDVLDARMIVIETTQLPEQSAARAFYEKSGYSHEGTVRDFYAEGEHKVIYRKMLA